MSMTGAVAAQGNAAAERDHAAPFIAPILAPAAAAATLTLVGWEFQRLFDRIRDRGQHVAQPLLILA